MAQAAAQLGLSQPAVSGVIADLERTLGVPLFERSTRGVTPTMYARAMLDRSAAVFDELKQGIRTIENLADPTAGELWIGCIESVSALVLPPIVQKFMQQYPRAVVHVLRLSSPTPNFRDLAERNLDIALGRMLREPAKESELSYEPFSDDRLVVAAGARSHWARRRNIKLADLADEPWVLAAPECRIHTALKEAFLEQGLKMPKVSLMSQSIQLRMRLVAAGPYLTVFPDSICSLPGYRRSISILPIDLPASPTPFAIITLKNRKLNPVAQCFIEHLRRHADVNLLSTIERPVLSRRLQSTKGDPHVRHNSKTRVSDEVT
jgi:DNA-binding transcriptional LysR family regulator